MHLAPGTSHLAPGTWHLAPLTSNPLPAYLLFVDTETTGLPRRWRQPYATEGAWPYVAQVAWQVYTPDGTLVKEACHYLPVPAGSMEPSALAVHGLTPDFLLAHGQEPATVLQLLLADLRTYRPRVIGYFLQLDFHVLGAAFHHAGLPNPLPELPQFCVMRLAERPPEQSPSPRRYLWLPELHEQLFAQPLLRAHDAYADAAATARCFFELQRRGAIPPAVLHGQPVLHEPRPRPRRRWARRSGRWWALAGGLVILLLALLLIWTLSPLRPPG